MLWLPKYTNNYYFTEISQNDASNNIKTTINSYLYHKARNYTFASMSTVYNTSR
jgi:N-acetylneuraminic acid mutarotase